MSRLVSAEELLILLNSNTTLIFIAKILLKPFFSNLLHPLKLKLEGTSCGPFQRQCFQVILIPQWTYFLLVRKIRPFSHDKVVITQSDACRWFYAPIYAKGLSLSTFFENICIEQHHLKQYTVLEIQSKPVNYAPVAKIYKNFDQKKVVVGVFKV